MGRLDGKVALISGAVQGIGQACAQRLAAEGAQVVIADLKEDDRTLSSIREAGGEAIQVQMDVRRRGDWQRTMSAGIDAFGRVDFLGNVAGVVNTLSEDSIVGLTDTAWDYVMDTNVRGTWLGMQALIPHMQANGGGRIVNISNPAALRGMDGSTSSAVSRAGVIGLTQQGARIHTQDNILINAICPGTADTAISGVEVTPELRASLANFQLIKRLGDPVEIAGMMAHFFSEDGALSVGRIETVDGG